MIRVRLVILALLSLPRVAHAFGEEGAFDPRVLITGAQTPPKSTGPARWALELSQRTSAPARLQPSVVRASDPKIVDGPFLYWSSREAAAPLTSTEIANLRRFFSLGGVLFIDDSGVNENGQPGPFAASSRREIARVLPETTPIALSPDHVLFRTFYLLRKPMGRVVSASPFEVIMRGGNVQVIFGSIDLAGALARTAMGGWESPLTPGGEMQREQAVRLAINIAMYVLCTNYKDDQVHAPFLMRRRTRLPFGMP